MKIIIKRFDKSLPLPMYKSPGAVGVDLCARVEVCIPAKTIGYIPLNIALEVPKGYWMMLTARSSTHKMGLMPGNGLGVMDEDFKGDNDEYVFIAYNFTDNEVTIEKGTRVAQMILMKHHRMEFDEVAQLKNSDRGKFGSTGHK